MIPIPSDKKTARALHCLRKLFSHVNGHLRSQLPLKGSEVLPDSEESQSANGVRMQGC